MNHPHFERSALISGEAGWLGRKEGQEVALWEQRPVQGLAADSSPPILL